MPDDTSGRTVGRVAVVIVNFRNTQDLPDCLSALSRIAEPPFEVLVCENGGEGPYRALLAALLAPDGPCRPVEGDASPPLAAPAGALVDVAVLRLRDRPIRVHVGRAAGNLGYAGGINAWLKPLLDVPGWDGAWVLNPDTVPHPDALAALVARAREGGKGMVGSTILRFDDPARVTCRGGLFWDDKRGAPALLHFNEALDSPFDLAAVEARMDAPSGSSVYVTRACLERIGLPDESYFLYYEDIDWGFRAKACGLGYASASLVPHKYGTTIGSSSHPRHRSRLAVYLEFRNRIRFARKHFPWRLPLVAGVSLLRTGHFLLALAPGNFRTALEGLAAGFKGETGPPRWIGP